MVFYFRVLILFHFIGWKFVNQYSLLIYFSFFHLDAES